MTLPNQTTILELVFFVLVPAVAGILVTQWAGDAAKKRHWPPHLVQATRVLLTVVWVSVVIAGVSVSVGPVNPLSTLTVSAVAGIGATLALQTVLQNVVAGYVLLRRRFLRLGDDVTIGSVHGRVAIVGLVTTVLRLEDGSLALVSNSNLLSGPLVNRTAGQRLAGEY
ncbi:MAG: mechanosensitive ion channel family protein [Thermoplasmata archaeon]|nr:mechanosensitive ion channel family protein [Thermoplasmata archaeon]MCI4355868.1 mechanosensitive ion channel family protein [Thermoplasmata archaeon]